MEYKYFLFDWDGSLGDTLPMWFTGFRETFAEYGLSVSDFTIGEKVIGDWEGPARLGITDSLGFFEKLEAKILPNLPHCQLNPGAGELLRRIKHGGGKIAIVTSSKRAYVEPALRNLGILGLMDVFLGKEDVSKYKPDPEMLNKALSLMRGTVEESVMTGDTVKDIEAARRSGMDSVLYYPKRYEQYYSRAMQKSLEAGRIIEDFGEITG